ncbi:hypothetical protein [Moorena sp. SIO3A2]|uniref:hypothetical protein n=1 Tax=Moorena sp. SIO3A2 TaxID=2607841 RepID=UPI0013BA7E99|nr:hypothetical protein [Moorena sp. SIO3A2]NER90329.1 hypothetical protein [Moorena sp. SIO3A2]
MNFKETYQEWNKENEKTLIFCTKAILFIGSLPVLTAAAYFFMVLSVAGGLLIVNWTGYLLNTVPDPPVCQQSQLDL